MRRTALGVRKTIVTLFGGMILLAGVVMLVTPGPGLVAIAAGLAVLGTEYHWAKRLLERVREHVARRKNSGEGGSD